MSATLIEQAQSNIMTLARATLASAVPDAEVAPAPRVHDVFELYASRKPTVYVVHEGFGLRGDQVVGRHGGIASGLETWSLACVATNQTDSMAAVRLVWALVEAVRGVREQDYSPVPESHRYLRFVGKETYIESPDRTARGGAIGIVLTFESSVHRI